MKGWQRTSALGFEAQTGQNGGGGIDKEKDFFLFSENIFMKRII
jgi:hypothetical protein